MSLKTDYKNDAYEGKRKYLLIDNGDGTYSLDDVTNYAVVGDIFNANDINATNEAINKNTQGLITERNTTEHQFSYERNITDQEIANERMKTDSQINSVKSDINNLSTSTSQSISALDTSLTKVQQVTFTSGGWTSSAPYTQQIAVSGMKSTDNPIPGIVYPSNMTETQKENIDKSSDMITELETLNGYIKATCKFKKPVTDITIGLKGR